MKLDLFNIDSFIKANHCQEVTSPIFFQYDGNPTPDGLFSYDIFGMSDDDRKNRFAYIDLHGHFLHPLIFIMMMGRMGSLRDILYGKKYAIIADKKVQIVNSEFRGAETGLSFFYDHFDDIDWINELDEVEIDSIDKKTRLKFLKSLTKDVFFVDKWLVLPPFYRDQSSTNRSMGDEINKLYKELISKARSLKSGFSFELFGDETKLRMQNILKDLFYTTLAPASGKHLMLEKGKTEGTLAGSGKNSMIRKHLLGKTVDWTASAVITSPQNNKANTASEKPVPFGYSAFPLATLLSMFQPFFVAFGVDTLESLLTTFASDFANEIKRINVAQFNSEEVGKMVSLFVKAPDHRFSPIEFKYISKDGKNVSRAIKIYEFKNEKDALNGENALERPLTIADFFYIAANTDVLRDKHVYVTRYPIANFQNIYPCRIKVLSTAKTRHVFIKVANKYADEIYEFEDYPTIRGYGSNLDSQFYDVMICGNVYLASLGGDYDGDMLYMKPIFTKEANAEADRLIFAKSNFLIADGKLSRTLQNTGKEYVMGLFELTKEVK